MSGPMPAAVAAAAAEFAQAALPLPADHRTAFLSHITGEQAREAARRARPAIEALRAKIAARSIATQRREAPSLAAETWARWPVKWRVLLALTLPGDIDPQRIAESPWGSLSADQRLELSVRAREAERVFRNAACLH